MKNQLGRMIAMALLLGSASAVTFAQSRGGGTGTPIGAQPTGAQGTAPAPNPNSNPNPNPSSSPIVNPSAADSSTTTVTGAPAPNPNSNPNPNPTSSPIVNPASLPNTTSSLPNANSALPNANSTLPNADSTLPNPNITSNPITNQNTMPATTPSGVPITTPTTGVTGPQSAMPMNSIQLNSAGTTATTPQIFATLDPNHKGYLSTADVASNKFLTDNFTRCDTNADGRLSQAEVTTCISGHR